MMHLATGSIRHFYRARCRAGFTLIELIIVVTVLGIVSTVSLPLFNQAVTESQLELAGSEVLSALNFARTRALTGQRSFRVSFNPGADRFEVQTLQFKHLDFLSNSNKDTVKGQHVDSATQWVEVAHPLHDAGKEENDWDGYVISFSASDYGGADLVSATFGTGTVVSFGPNGIPDEGGTVIVRLGSQVREITVNAATGAISIS